MSTRSKALRSALVLAVVVPALTAGAVSAATAYPHPHQPTVTLFGEGTVSLAGTEIASVSFSAKRTGSVPTQQVRGRFAGTLKQLPVTLRGPVTCLTVQGNTASFIYPIDSSSSPSLAGMAMSGIQITVTKGVGGAPSTLGFNPPEPSLLQTSCSPQPTPFTFTGTLLVNGH